MAAPQANHREVQDLKAWNAELGDKRLRDIAYAIEGSIPSRLYGQ